ncbi:MAG: hypothetical protein U0350_41935 [Caldilineaceae bacterium]
MARSRYKIVPGYEQAPYFLTATTVNWAPLFSSRSIVQIGLDSLRFLQMNDRLILYAYVIRENHLHLVAASAALSSAISRFKAYTVRQIIDFLEMHKAVHVLHQLEFYKAAHKTERTYQLWQEGSHPELIQGEAMLRQKIEYIHNNPVPRGYVDLPIQWRYSSVRNCVGLEGLLGVKTAW